MLQRFSMFLKVYSQHFSTTLTITMVVCAFSAALFLVLLLHMMVTLDVSLVASAGGGL